MLCVVMTAARSAFSHRVDAWMPMRDRLRVLHCIGDFDLRSNDRNCERNENRNNGNRL